MALVAPKGGNLIDDRADCSVIHRLSIDPPELLSLLPGDIHRLGNLTKQVDRRTSRNDHYS
jgi:hypothetical protein